MGEMLSMIAHQWRQPLNAVSAAAISIKMKSELQMLDDKTIDEQMSFIEQQAQKMSQTINDFMNFFKPKKEKEEFFLRECIGMVVNMMGAQLKVRSIDLDIDVDPKIKMCGVKNEIEHVFLNIIANSRDAIEEKKPNERKVFLKATQDDKSIVITIEDTAGGIPDKLIDRIFDPYFTTKEEGKGTGIGLHMCYNIIKKHSGGSIEVENTTNGARFTIVIPEVKC